MDRYRVLKRIGVGTYGSAYLVCDKRNPAQEFVLKKIKLDDKDEKERQQAEMEAQILCKLDHPFVLG
jgi:NIMA (never in mitosis gene a)-related kinase